MSARLGLISHEMLEGIERLLQSLIRDAMQNLDTDRFDDFSTFIHYLSLVLYMTSDKVI